MMTTVWIIAFIILLFALYRTHHRLEKALGRTVLLGLVAGLAFGFVLKHVNPNAHDALDWINILGNGYVSLLKLIAMPLVFISILSAITKVEQQTMIGTMSLWVIGILIGTTALATLDGALIANVFELNAQSLVAGSSETARGASLLTRSQALQDTSLATMIGNFIPRNIVETLAELTPTAMLSAVIIATLLGIAALRVKKQMPEQGERILAIIETLQLWVMELVRMIIRMTPYGVMALMIKVMVTTNVGAIVQLAKFLVASYVALFIMLIVHGLLIALLTKQRARDYFRRVFPVLSFAFTSRSSAATIPLNIDTQIKELKIAPAIANFSASFGATIGQNGCAGVYPAMLAIMIAPTVGIDPWSLSFITTIVIVAAIGSFGVAGVGGGATFAAIIVLGALGLPVELAGLLIAIEPLIDMMRTAVNVSGSMVAGSITHRFVAHKL